MKSRSLAALGLATLVVLAGCAGGVSDLGENSPTDDSTQTGTEATPVNGGAASADTGVVQFYVSDEKNAIGDFEHLNVTITKVGFQKAGDGDDDEETESRDTATETATATADSNETATATSTATDTVDPNATVTATATDTATATTTATSTATAAETEESEDEAEEEGENDEESESGGWTEYEVDDRTVDLTELQGDNATLLQSFNVSEGEYNKVFVYVSEINATLENGDSVNVKLPSQKLQLNKGFTVEANDSVDFVFDITVFKAGNSGKYILKPVISESGTDVPIERVDDEGRDTERDEDRNEREDRENRDDDRAEQADDEEETELSATFVGPVEPGENVTVRVTENGSAVANATVYLDDEMVGTTDDAGELTFALSSDAEEIEVTIESGDAEAELEAEFEEREGEGEGENRGNGQGQ